MAIFKKKDNYYIDYYDENKKRMRERVGPSHRLAVDVLNKRKVEVSERRFFPERHVSLAPSPTFSEFAKKFWTNHGQGFKSGAWLYMKEILCDHFGTMRLSEMTPERVKDYYDEKRASRSVATANRYRMLLRLMFSKAKEWGDHQGENPVDKVKRKREDNHRTRFLSAGEIARLLEVAEDVIKPILQVAILTGMRRGELLGLDWRNVNIETRSIHLLKTKSEKPRVLPITPTVLGVLTQLGPKSAGSVFGITIGQLRCSWERARTAAGLDDVRFHDLRHTFASHFTMRTKDRPTLQVLLGHSTSVMTERYSHLDAAHIASAIATLDSLIPSARGAGGSAEGS